MPAAYGMWQACCWLLSVYTKSPFAKVDCLRVCMHCEVNFKQPLLVVHYFTHVRTYVRMSVTVCFCARKTVF